MSLWFDHFTISAWSLGGGGFDTRDVPVGCLHDFCNH